MFPLSFHVIGIIFWTWLSYGVLDDKCFYCVNCEGKFW